MAIDRSNLINDPKAKTNLDLKLINNYDNSLNPIERVLLTNDLIDNPALLGLVREYCQLANKPELSDTDLERLAKIYELAEYDKELDRWIERIDENVDSLSIVLRQSDEIKQSDKLSLEEFISKVRQISSEEVTVEKFEELTSKVELSDTLICEHIGFDSRSYCRQNICSTSFGSIFIIGWQPNQASMRHSHTGDISVIRVYKGELTNELFDEEQEEVNVSLNGRQKHGFKPFFKPVQERKYTENEVLCIDQYQTHRLSNQSDENLVTVHFKFFKQSTQKEDYISSPLSIDSTKTSMKNW